MQAFAITIKETKEFYPDPTYNNKEKAENKIKYLTEYRVKNKMDFVEYVLEDLTPERLAKHKQEWSKWVGLID